MWDSGRHVWVSPQALDIWWVKVTHSNKFEDTTDRLNSFLKQPYANLNQLGCH